MLFNLTLQVRETYTQKAGIVNRRTKLLGDIVRPSWIHRTGQCQAIWGNNGAKRRTARTSGGRHRRCGTQLGPPSYLNPRSQNRDLGHPPKSRQSPIMRDVVSDGGIVGDVKDRLHFSMFDDLRYTVHFDQNEARILRSTIDRLVRPANLFQNTSASVLQDESRSRPKGIRVVVECQ